MSKASKHPGLPEDLRRWDNEGGAPRSGHHPSEATPVAHHELYFFRIRTASGVIEDPEGSAHPDLESARKQALSEARRIVAEGDRQGEDRRSWSFEIMERDNRLALTIRFSEAGEPAGR